MKNCGINSLHSEQKITKLGKEKQIEKTGCSVRFYKIGSKQIDLFVSSGQCLACMLSSPDLKQSNNWQCFVATKKPLDSKIVKSMVSVELPVTKCLRHYTVKPDFNYTCEIRSPVLSDVVLTKELRLTLSGFSIYRFLELKTSSL